MLYDVLLHESAPPAEWDEKIIDSNRKCGKDMKGWIITYDSSEGVYVYMGGTPKFGSRAERDALNAVRDMSRKMKDQHEIDWEQRRYEVASSALNALLSNPASLSADILHFSKREDMTLEEKQKAIFEVNVKESVMIADALIAELKKGEAR